MNHGSIPVPEDPQVTHPGSKAPLQPQRPYSHTQPKTPPRRLHVHVHAGHARAPWMASRLRLPWQPLVLVAGPELELQSFLHGLLAHRLLALLPADGGWRVMSDWLLVLNTKRSGVVRVRE